MKYLAPCLAAIVAWSCSSTPEKPAAPLPFSVAVVPIEAFTEREVKTDNPEDVTEMKMRPDVTELTKSLVAALDKRTFTRATLLSSFGEHSDKNPSEKQAAWLEEARRAGADLVLTCALECAPSIRQEPNANFWLNMPLFLIGGPFCYFIKDRTYYADVELVGGFYDPRRIQDDVAMGESENIGARVLQTSARFQSIDMNFIDRAGSNEGKYAASLICPSGFLAKEGKSVKDELTHEVIKALSRDLAKNVQIKRDELLRAEYLAPFYLDCDAVAISRRADGKLEFQGTANLRRGERIERMDRFRLKSAGKSWEGDFSNVKPTEGVVRGGRYLQYPIAQVLDAAPDTKELSLELEAGTTQRYVRTYTFALP